MDESSGAAKYEGNCAGVRKDVEDTHVLFKMGMSVIIRGGMSEVRSNLTKDSLCRFMKIIPSSGQVLPDGHSE